jgi:hypothetical protein
LKPTDPQNSQTDIHHYQSEQEFRIELDDAPAAYVRYSLDSKANSVDFTSTFVPDSHRGQGIAERLINEAFAWAEQSHLIVKTSCWYAQLKYQGRAEMPNSKLDA